MPCRRPHLQVFGHAEVEQHRLAVVGEQDVRRLQIVVQDAVKSARAPARPPMVRMALIHTRPLSSCVSQFGSQLWLINMGMEWPSMTTGAVPQSKEVGDWSLFVALSASAFVQARAGVLGDASALADRVVV